ncbi:MAG: hypothetical protein K6G18_14070 [Treponema sp.]|nr:hypothetical protein [Treponema sp.]
MKKQLVFSKDGNLYLDTGMTQDAFSKARITDRLGERGIKAEHSEQEDRKVWSFSKWTFSGTKMADETVLLEGFLFSGLPLASFLENNTKEKAYLAGARVCSAMEAAMNQGQVLPRVGAGGIFISADFERILFLPEGLFEMATSCLSSGGTSGAEEVTLANASQGFFINRLLTGEAANSFTQSVIAYRLLADELPFTEVDEDKREEDIRDKNYVHMTHRVWGLDSELAQRIDQSLQQTGTSSQQKKASLHFPTATLYRELGLTEDGNIASDGNLIEIIRKSNISHEEFDRRAKKERTGFLSALARKRWIRRHRSLLTLLAVGLFALAVIAGICVETAMTRPCTRGLTETQTVEMFYSSFNTMDVLSANASAVGKDANLVIDAMSAYFVSAKTKENYDSGSKTTSPAEWLSFNNGGSFSIYGISQFFIGNKKGEIFFTAPSRKDAPRPVTESEGTELKKGTSKKLEVSYYFIYSGGNEMDGKETIEALKKTDTVTLSYKGGQWKITKLEQQEGTKFSVDKDAFYADYKEAFDAYGQDSVKATDAIRTKYVWLPLGSEILEGIEKIKSDYM